MASSAWRSVLGRLVDVAVRQGGRELSRRARRRATPDRAPSPRRTTAPAVPPRATLPPAAPPRARRSLVTEHTGPVRLEYRPHDDDRPDPGEIVWAWVPFEEGDGRGKDRPVLVVGRDGDSLLALLMSSQDHDRDAADEARHGRHWVDIGSGAWDRQGRPSEVRVDRVLRIDPADVRREGATLGRDRFEEVAAEVSRRRG
jgi:PemK-like, MazF-like toxin of type II toxin-antitoxin system